MVDKGRRVDEADIVGQMGCPVDCARCPEDRAVTPRLGCIGAKLRWSNPIYGGSQRVPGTGPGSV